jgi:hypothetical protein
VLWDVDTLGVLAVEFQSHGTPLVVAQTPVTAAQVRAQFPRLVSWFEANQLLAAVLVGVGALVLIALFSVGLVLLLALASH